MIAGGLDISDKGTGYAFGARNSVPTAGVFQLMGLNDRDRPRSCASLYSAVNHLVRENGIQFMGIEAPLMLKGKSAHTERSLTMLSGAAQAGAANGGAKVLPLVGASTWRKAVLGQGFPDDPKAMMLRYCRMLSWPIDDEDAAEAAGIWQWACGQIYVPDPAPVQKSLL